MDPWLEFALFRTVHELRREWYPEFQKGTRLFDDDPNRIVDRALAAYRSQMLPDAEDGCVDR